MKTGSLLGKLKSSIDTLAKWMGTPLARKLVYALFLIQAIYLVFMVPIGVPPDELAHIRIVEQYVQQEKPLPTITEQTNHSLGDITRNTDYFYHYALSLLARILPVDGLALYVVFRLVSVCIVFATLVAGARLIRRLGASEAVTTVGLLIVTNFAQFLFMSAAINQDQVVWLGATVGALLLVRLWQKINVVDMLLLTNVVLFAAISKKTFLPIAVLFGVVLLALILRQRKQFAKVVKEAAKQWKPAVVVLGLLAMVGIGLNVERFGYNIVTYKQISVACDKIHTYEQCMEHGVFRRNANLRTEKPVEFTPQPITEFAPYWHYSNYRGVFGTQGWNGRAMPDPWAYDVLLAITTASLALGIAYYVRWWRRPESLIFMASLVYIAVQMSVNYGVYLTYGAQGLALQGRYIFPIIVPLVLVLVYMWSLALRRWRTLRSMLAIGVVVLILAQSGMSAIIRSNLYTDTPLQPVVLFDPDNAISGYEPGV